MAAFRKEWFIGEDRVWNVFDALLVILSMMEFAVRQSKIKLDLSYLRVLRLLRVIRVVRIVRVFRFFRELRMMLSSIMHCVRSLVWVLLVLGVAIYIMALFLVQDVTVFRVDNCIESWSEDPRCSGLAFYFGDLY